MTPKQERIVAEKEKREAAENAILDRIIETVPTSTNAGAIRDLAEAWAWIRTPSRSHSG